MKFERFIKKVADGNLFKKDSGVIVSPRLIDAYRFPYGPFKFRTHLAKGTDYTIFASSDYQNWKPIANGTCESESIDYVDSDAFQHSYRFYRLFAEETSSMNVIGYVTVTMPPGFSMLANPLDAPSNTVAELFKEWPDGTTLNKFDTRFFRLDENAIKQGKWLNSSEKMMPGEGAIFFNPTNDYKSVSFVGELMQGNLSIPIPSGFSIRSSPVPKAGHLQDDLGFPIAEGDVIHLFDRDRQKYVLHPYENGKWPAGPPILSVGEAFWVAKTMPGNWTRSVFVG
jgi:hypothetical protein